MGGVYHPADRPTHKGSTRRMFFRATHSGAELDLLILKGRNRYGFEVRRTTTPGITPSMRNALSDLGLNRLDIIHAGNQTFSLAEKVRAVSWRRLLKDI